MTQSLGLQRLTKVLGDQSRSTIRHQPGPIRQRCLFHTRSLTSRLDDLGEVSSTHGRLESPDQDSPAKVIQYRDQMVPAPVLDQKIRSHLNFFPKRDRDPGETKGGSLPPGGKDLMGRP